MAQGATAGPKHARLERAVADLTVDTAILKAVAGRRLAREPQAGRAHLAARGAKGSQE